jgi:5'-methylthioadenosine phosphorylase
LRQAKIALIGGTGLERLVEETEKFRIKTSYGLSPPISRGIIGDYPVVFLARHGPKHEVPPHKVNYRANIWSLKKIGVERIISTNAVGAINEKYKPGDLVVPSDIIDFTRTRITTFYDKAPVVHIDVTNPYCPELREFLLASLERLGQQCWGESVLAATEGPRFETPAEIRMMRSVGCDVVGMTGSPEVFLARELEMCYVTMCFVSNMAAGIRNKLTSEEVVEMAQKSTPILRRSVENLIASIPKERKCSCSKALEHAKM